MATVAPVSVPRPASGPPAGTPRLAAAWWRWAIPVGVAVVILALPPPPGLSRPAWRYFGLFSGVVAGLMVEPLPAPAVGFVGIAIGAASGLVASDPEASLKWALSGFGNGTVWLIFAAFMLALGYERTGLGRRLALPLVRYLGASTLGLGYAIALADLILAPFTPSNTARSAGTIFPIIRNIPPLYDSQPGAGARRIGAYLMWVAFAATTVTASMFATALAPNLLALDLVEKGVGIRISMASWALGFAPVGLVLLGALPWLVYRLYPPEIKGGPEVPAWAAAEYARLGPITRGEVTMAALAVVAVALWMTAGGYLEAATVALLVISVMLVAGVVTWRDILANESAWNVLVLLATLVTLADGLHKVGFIGWFANAAAAALTGVPPVAVIAGLVVAFFVVHYMFASVTAHTTAVLPVVLAAGAAVPGMPLRTFALLLCYSLGVMGVLTPYACGPAPAYFASGFVSRKEFWTLGLVFGMIFLATLLLVGLPFLMVVEP